jgi:hypothetical protein
MSFNDDEAYLCNSNLVKIVRLLVITMLLEVNNAYIFASLNSWID